MIDCPSCKWHRVRFFPSPDSHDGVAGTYSDRCMRYTPLNADNPEYIGWVCVAETAPGPQGWAGRCGPERKNWEAKS